MSMRGIQNKNLRKLQSKPATLMMDLDLARHSTNSLPTMAKLWVKMVVHRPPSVLQPLRLIMYQTLRNKRATLISLISILMRLIHLTRNLSQLKSISMIFLGQLRWRSHLHSFRTKLTSSSSTIFQAIKTIKTNSSSMGSQTLLKQLRPLIPSISTTLQSIIQIPSHSNSSSSSSQQPPMQINQSK